MCLDYCKVIGDPNAAFKQGYLHRTVMACFTQHETSHCLWQSFK